MVKNILVVEKILSANDRIAAENREIFDTARIKAFNLMASPGAGKTSLIEQTIKHLLPHVNIAVIDGDIATNIDAERAEGCRRTGDPNQYGRRMSSGCSDGQFGT
jgi:hydrogenase nickel incorporation protein HypB